MNHLRTSRLQMLLTAEERTVFEGAAQALGETLSAWMRGACRQRALREKGIALGLVEAPRRRRK